MHALLLALLCSLPAPSIDEANAVDLIVLNHIDATGGGYSQLVVIRDDKIIDCIWQPMFHRSQAGQWLHVSKVGEFHLATVRDYYGEIETWRSRQYVEVRTPSAEWMSRFEDCEL